MENKINKYTRGAIPALLLHLSVGSVYAWSLFVNPLSKYMNISASKIQFAFSLAIFFLGMSAAFGGKMVEKNVHKSALVGTICFISGLLISAIGVFFKQLSILYLGYGVIGGIGLGITYLTPCKTLMAWFQKNKGLAMGLSVMGFGFGSTIASPIITRLMGKVDVWQVFIILGCIYFIPMMSGFLLLKKPKSFEETDKNNIEKFSYLSVIKKREFILMWIMFYLNIHCGLALISNASPILTKLNTPISIVAITVSIMGIFNGAGRLIYSTISDRLKHRINIYKWIFGLSILTMILCLIIKNNFPIIAFTLCMISSLYGAGFSNIAPLLSDKFGMTNISKIHGAILSAWAIAGLTGNTMSTVIFSFTGNYNYIFMAIGILYIAAFICIIGLQKEDIKNNDYNRLK